MDSLAALAGALREAPAPDVQADLSTPPSISLTLNRPAQTPVIDEAVLAGLSAVDFVQTESYLVRTPTNGRKNWNGGIAPAEYDPLLGKHPTVLRLLATGAVMDFLVLRVKSPWVRRIGIGIEGGNITRNGFVDHIGPPKRR